MCKSAELQLARGEVISGLFVYASLTRSILDMENQRDMERTLEAKRVFRDKGARLIAVANAVPFLSSRNKSELILSGQLLINVADLLGNAHTDDEKELISKLTFVIAKKLKVVYLESDALDISVDEA